MRFWRQYKPALLFSAFLLACSVLILHQFQVNQRRHVELREAFLLLVSKGYQPQAKHLYQRLVSGLPRLSTTQLVEDLQRTSPLTDATAKNPENLIWRYHCSLSNEMEKRSVETLAQALKLADEP